MISLVYFYYFLFYTDLLSKFPEVHEEVKLLANEYNKKVDQALSHRKYAEESERKKKREALLEKRKQILELYK